MGWQGEEHRERKGEAYEADFDFHYTESGAKDRLAVWQGLCKEVELGEIPASINKCKEVFFTS